jgi:hypothetical protein
VQRRREIASSPQRAADETWRVITELVGATLERSPNIARSAVDSTMAVADGVGRMLIAGGHLEGNPIVVVAGQLWLEIATISGDRALTIKENLSPVPGAATADDWTVHLPAEGPLAKIIKNAATTDDHLSADEPTAPESAEGSQSVGTLDEAALARWAEEKP